MHFRLLIVLCSIWLYANSVNAQTPARTTLPMVYIDTDEDIPSEPKITGRMQIVYRGPGQYTLRTDRNNPDYLDYNGFIGIELRGQSSQGIFPKKQYGIETRMPNGENLNVSLLGFPEENDWILHAPYSDKTLLRNALAYTLARRMGSYATRIQFVELVLNGQYDGAYILMEKIKRDRQRVNIAQLDADDVTGDSLTGGYIIKVDKDASEGNSWPSNFEVRGHTVRYQYHDPRLRELQPAQATYIRNYMSDFEHVMAGPDYADPLTGYPAYLDLASFVDFILLNEFGKNVDGYRISTFMHKDRGDRGGKLNAGPAWDFNLAFGNANYYDGETPRRWFILNGPSDTDGFQLSFWWPRLFNDANFQKLLNSRWQQLRTEFLHQDSVTTWVDAQVEILDGAQQRNFERWPSLGEYVWPNPDGAQERDTYEKEIDALKTWLQQRADWIDVFIGTDARCTAEAVINEIHYRPGPDSVAGEWLELHNPTDRPLEVSDWVLRDQTNQTAFALPAGTTIPTDGYLILAVDDAAFQAAYPGIPVLGPLGFKLNNGGELLTLYDQAGCLADHVRYDDDAPWPENADGTGHSLFLLNPLLDNGLAASWAASETPGGTPGAANPTIDVDLPPPVPQTSGLSAAYPNPFQTTTTLDLSLAEASRVTITLHDLQGRRVRHIETATNFSPTKHQIPIDGIGLAGGVYIVRVETARWVKYRKITLLP